VILEQQRVVVWNEWQHAIAQSRRAGQSIGGERHGAEVDDDFRQQSLVQGASCSSKSGRHRRVSVDYCPHIGAQTIDRHMHGDLARAFTFAG